MTDRKINTPELILPKNDITLTHHGRINSICSPLKKFGISFFNYLKVFKDGTIADINNAPQMTEYFYYKSTVYQKFLPITANTSFNSGIVLSDSMPDKDFFMMMKNNFDIDHVIFFVTKENNSTTYWQFGTYAGNDNILNFYLNNQELLKSFCTYFEKTHIELLNLSHENKYKIEFIENIITDTDNNFLYPYDINDIKNTISQLRLENNSSLSLLTNREKECLKLVGLGKTAEEVAIILNTSKRTVEKHIQNMKTKLNCSKITHLISKATTYLIIDV
jgi:LuxR family quorum-sensing system transcriptional regulator SolR